MDIWKIAAPALLTYFLIVVRLGSLFLVTPFFSSTNYPAKIKIFLALVMAFLVFPGVRPLTTLPDHPLNYAVLLGKELLIGVVIGYSCQIVFQAIQMAGKFIGYQMMFQMVNVLDPESNIQVSLIGQIEFLVAILIFLVINGHYWLLKAMIDSFTLVPLGAVKMNAGAMLREFDKMFGTLFIIAFQVSAPAAGVLFLTRFTMGLMARVMPQMNVFIVGMPLYVGVGLLTTALSLGMSYVIFEKYFANMINEVYTLLRLMA